MRDGDGERKGKARGIIQRRDAVREAICALLVENARIRSEEERLAHELHEAWAALDRAHLRQSYRVREKLLRGVRRTAVGRGLHRVYRLARGRSSRPA